MKRLKEAGHDEARRDKAGWAEGCGRYPAGDEHQKLTLPGDERALIAVSAFVMRAAGQARLDLTTAYRLRLAVEEIAANIVTHGYLEAGLSGPLLLYAEWDGVRLLLHLEDCGLHFDPRRQGPPVSLHLPPEKREIGGLGIFLALGNVDRFEYGREGEFNRSTFVVRLGSKR
jgi:anti-sigma regulatory factor (Ser/Thr protein kinase)